MAKIFIIDNDIVQVRALSIKLASEDNMLVIGSATNGKEGLEFIQNYNGVIDLLILDLLIPVYDGTKVLSDINRKFRNKVKKIIVTSAMFTPESISLLQRDNANYTLLKPYSLDSIVDIVYTVLNRDLFLDRGKVADTYRSLSTNKQKDVNEEQRIFKLKVEKEVSSLLHEFGIPASIKGYVFLRMAIIEAFYTRSYIGRVTKDLYPEIARRVNSTSSRVERAIRHAIEIAWERGNVDLINEYFGYTIAVDKSKPTNSEFIAMVADSLRTQFEISQVDHVKSY